MKRISFLLGLTLLAGTAISLSAGAPTQVLAKQGIQTADASSQGVVAVDAWIPTAPSTAKAHAAYLVLHNRGAEARAVTAVSSPQYQMAHLHVTRMENGVATMQSLAQVEVPAGGMAAFEPGGLHIMLMKPKAKLKAGDQIEIALVLDNETELKVMAVIKERPKGSKTHQGHEHKHTH